MVVKLCKRILSALIVCVLSVTHCYAGKVYVYRNADGVLVFSDAPQGDKKAEEIKLTTKPAVVPSEDTDIFNPGRQVAAPAQYTVIINQPANGATVRDNTGSVYVSGGVSPNFQAGYQIRLMLDGQQYGKNLGRTTQILRNIDRGEHSLQMELLDKTGKVIASSELVTFYMHRASVKPKAAR